MSLIPFGFWAASGAGGGGAAYELLETTTLASAASSVTFSGLGSYSDYAHLQIRAVVARGDDFSVLIDLELRINADLTGDNYASHRLEGNGSAVTSDRILASGDIRLPNVVPAVTESNVFGASVIDILDFSSTDKNTTVRALSGAVSADENSVSLASGLYALTDAVTSIRLNAGNLRVGSRFSLYGIKGA